MIVEALRALIQVDLVNCGVRRTYVNFADVVLAQGTLFKLPTEPGQTLTKVADHHVHVHDYCLNVALRTEGYHYVEGYVYHQGAVFSHVWVVDNQGSAYDLCLPEDPHAEYYGLEISLSVARVRKWSGVFDMRVEARKGYPILSGSQHIKAANAWF